MPNATQRSDYDSVLPRATGLSDMLAGRLAAAIRAGEFRPGARLPTEKRLVEQYGVSRAVVREAFARLKADGFIDTRQGAGAFVAAKPGLANFRIARPESDGRIAPADLAHIFELRAVIEAGMAELAARRRNPADLTALKTAFAEMQQALQAGRDGHGAAADDTFHAAIATAAHNPYLAQFAAFLAQHFSATRALTWAARDDGSAAAAQAEHARLLAAIEAGDAAGAARAARDHIFAAAARHGAAAQETTVKD
ncbi:MAG: FadR/GntR family transcriptional regulator [Ferrovibrio sp.]|uniref:FadR/GntR family transcriptional regulator n=1 Tax=Ferrovibrio sp. TaxID=1917215 RepID=UPI003918ACEC